MKFTWLKYLTRITLPIALLLSLVLLAAWVPSALQGSLGEVCASAGLMMCNAALLTFMIRQTGGSREYNGLSYIVYMMAVTAIPALHTYWKGQLVTLMVLFVIFTIHNSYMEQDNMREAFRNTLILYIGSLIVNDVIWLIPLLWIGHGVLGTLHLRTWLASVMALVTAVIWTGVLVFFGWMELPFVTILQRSWFITSVTDWNAWCQLGLLVLTVIFMIAVALHTDRDSIRRRKLAALFGWTMVFATLSTLFPSNETLFPLAQSSLAGIAVLYLLQQPTEGRGRMFIFYILSCVVLYIAPYALTEWLHF